MWFSVISLGIAGAVSTTAWAGGPHLAALADPAGDRPRFDGEPVVESAGDGASADPKRREQSGPSMQQQRQERDDLRRQDLAAALARQGVPLRWPEHTLVTLTDWNDRLQAAGALRTQYGVDVDWRTSSLETLTDMRLRAAKAVALSRDYGLQVDWRRYSWVALESLRRQVAKLPPTAGRGAAPATDDDRLAAPTFADRSVGGSSGRSKRWRDADGIMEPTFAFNAVSMVWSRTAARRGGFDPDAILVPRFAAVPGRPLGPDDLLQPAPVRRSSRSVRGVDSEAPSSQNKLSPARR